jgi:preflagellin peptidase FlaK
VKVVIYAVETDVALWIMALLITIVILVIASIKDWMEREVPDICWAVLGIAGLALFFSYSVYLTGFRMEYIPLSAAVVLVILDILWEDNIFHPVAYYFTMGLLFIVPLYRLLPEDVEMAKIWVSIPLCYLLYVGLHYLNVIRGGADVKCLITLSIVFPVYPMLFGLPLIEVPGTAVSQIIVFSISVLFVAALMSIPIALYIASKNAKEGFSKKRFTSYKMEISKAESSKVWPLEDIVDGKCVPIKIPEEEDFGSIYSRLREAGMEEVRVTPMIPFIILITIAVAIVVVIGSPLFLIA